MTSGYFIVTIFDSWSSFKLRKMNILISDSWLREYLDTKATPSEIKECLSLCGPSVEKIEKAGNDYIYHIEITTNRIDTVSVYGIAREAAAILPRFGIPARLKPLPSTFLPGPTDTLPLTLSDEDKLCDRLLAVVLTHVSIGPSSPRIKERLAKAGVRSLSNLIDITNYCMLELGHPCHVFDYDRIKTGKLIIRRAKRGEKLITLDNKTCVLEDQDIVIDDGSGRIIDLPGIIGTANSVVTGETKRAVLFIESNNPAAIRKTSMRLGVRTLAATINEKHPDPELAKTTILRAVELSQREAQAKAASRLTDIYPHTVTPKSVTVSFDFIHTRLGVTLQKKEIREILTSLDFSLASTSTHLTITPPSFRQFDIAIPEDIVEEVARIYGYHNLPARLMTGELPLPVRQPELATEEKIKIALKYWGYTETYSYSFISKKLIKKVNLDPDTHVKIKNPLTEETGYMRTSLLPSLLTVAAQNQYVSDTLSLFELSKVYQRQKDTLPKEESMLALAQYADFFHLKGTLDALLLEIGFSNYTMQALEIPSFFHPKQSLSIFSGNRYIGTFGKIHPFLETIFMLKNDLYITELDLTRILPLCNPEKTYREISPYIPIKEDFTLNIPKAIPVGDIMAEIKKADTYITAVRLKDQFEKSMTLEVTYHDPKKNLTGEITQKIRGEIFSHLKKKWGIILKG